MRLHVLGIPHTVTSSAWSHCAFTNNVRHFAPMMRPLGYEVIHYGNAIADATSGATEDVEILTRAELEAFVGAYDPASPEFGANHANTDTALYHAFNTRLRGQLRARVTADDLVCLPFGHAHAEAVIGVPGLHVETGVGYPALGPGRFRIYESSAWMHWHYGHYSAEIRGQAQGNNYDFVIHHACDPEEFPAVVAQPGVPTVVYLGRLMADKGLDVICEVAARRPEVAFILCGQGDATPWLRSPNITYRPPVHGADRAALLGAACAVMLPTLYVEPGSHTCIEAQMCGTPVLTSDWGCFPELVMHGATGFRCRVLTDWLAAIDYVPRLDRMVIEALTRDRFSLGEAGRTYDRAFQQIAELGAGGWHTSPSRMGIP